MVKQSKNIAIIGGGWAGCAAAVELANKSHKVTIFEASNVLGGRARHVQLHGHDLDNGQHILLGAYAESLRLIEQVGGDRRSDFLNMPLQMRYPPNNMCLDFLTPRIFAPWHLAIALFKAKGFNFADKLALMRFMSAAKWMKWELYNDCSVSEFLHRFDQTPNLMAYLWEPLCVSALNTPADQASAQVFLNVLRDSLGAKRSASDMLIPKRDLTALFPQRAATYLEQRGGRIVYGQQVRQINQIDQGWEVCGEPFDAVVVAIPPMQAENLLRNWVNVDDLSDFEYEAITTCYLQYDADVCLEQPFYALEENTDAQHWGQFVFDRCHFSKNQAGMFAVVISASTKAVSVGSDGIVAGVSSQLAQSFGQQALLTPIWSQVITDRRATFSCHPSLKRPENKTEMDNLVIAGDYTKNPYPATLEAAVQSGIQAAKLLV